uniref:G-protein coupled bile acid receptor 1 n=1 Tax=Salvator merianae TaxID=96440 RepID=A0A8D0BR68_SALMN
RRKNHTSPFPESPPKKILFILVFSNPLSLFIILANIFIIVGILLNRKLHTTMNWFFLSLLFADLLAGAALPSISELTINNKRLDVHYCFLKYLAPNFLFLSFLANLLIVHYARYVCILQPLHYHCSWIHRWSGLHILAAWTAPLIFACLPVAWNQWEPQSNCTSMRVFPMPYLYLETYGFLIPSILAMAFMCVRMLCVARRQLKNITKLLRSVNKDQVPTELEQQLELRNAKSTASVSLIFLICWLPYIACLNISLLAIKNDIDPLINTIVTCIGTGSAAAVPIALTFGNQQYTQFWKDLCTRFCEGCCRGKGREQRQIKPKENSSSGYHASSGLCTQCC